MHLDIRFWLEAQYGNIPERNWRSFERKLFEMKVLTNDYIQEEGQTCRHIWFLKSGAIRCFERKDSVEYTLHLYTENTFFTDYNSLLFRRPSFFYYQAVEPCKLIQITGKDFNCLSDQSALFARIASGIAEQNFILENEYRKWLLFYKPFERLQLIKQQRPDLIRRFSKKDIASFIGISPDYLKQLNK